MSHLQIHHGGSANADNWPSDRHWHWEFPSHGEIAWGGQPDTIPAFEALFAEREHGFPIACVSPSSDWMLPIGLTVSLTDAFVSRYERPTFQTVGLLNSRQSLPQLLGIHRC